MTFALRARPFGCLLVVAVVGLLGGCSTSDGSIPSTTAPSSVAALTSSLPTVTSTSSASTVTSSATETSPTVSTATSPWPADLTPDQVAAAQAAIAAYGSYWTVPDQAGAKPSQDWSG